MRRVDQLVSEGGLSASLYNRICSSTKALLKPDNLIDATFTQAAVDELLANDRIFSDYGGKRASRTDAKPVPQPCAMTVRTLGTSTLADVRRKESAALAAKAHHHAGNWVVMRRPGVPKDDARAYVTLCGFYDCRRPSAKAPGARIERLVKHMNLCRYATEKDETLRYLTSGTFVAGCDGPADRKPEVLVNARSGSWAMAKAFLRASGTTTDAELDKIDDQVVRFASAKVRRVVLGALLRPAGRRRTSRS